jgi:1,2-diacylglycerol 3-alpha-glucosyltransferase
MDYRKAYGLPERYFLSLGRMVEKKNLATLIAAYGRYCDEWREPESAEIGRRGDQTSDESARQAPASLVFVGSGELESALREQARALGLRVVDRTEWKAGEREQGSGDGGQETGPLARGAHGSERQSSETRDSLPATSHEENCGTVCFYGFRQIEENAVFYALAEAFVLPSLKEEWGLVVNEAMAAGLPVIVSRTAGCAEDLLPEATASRSSQCSVGSVQFGGSETTENCKPQTENSLELRSNGFVFDPSSVDALSEALRRIAEGETADGGAEPARQPIGKPAATLKAEMGRRSREIVGKFGCENFARQALRAAEEASAP